MNQGENEVYTMLAYMHSIFAGGLAGGAAWIAPYLVAAPILGPPIDLIGLPIILHVASFSAGIAAGLFVGHYTLRKLLNRIEKANQE